MLRHCRHALIKHKFQAVMVSANRKMTPPQVRAPVTDDLHEADELPLVGCQLGWRAANNLLKLSPAIPTTPDELDELVSYQTNQKDVNAENNLEIGSENNLEQICSLRPQESKNNLKRKVNQELEV